jgi:hypothetical protein
MMNRRPPKLPPPSITPVYRQETGAFGLAVVIVLTAVVFAVFAWKGLL